MTLNEAITHAKEKAAESRERNCIECAVEHEQLAVWLEELNKFQWIPIEWRETTAEDGIDPEEFPLMACGELPENGQDILVTNGCHVWSDTFFDDNGLYLDSGNDLVENVTAWMPLPEPYIPVGLEDPE